MLLFHFLTITLLLFSSNRHPPSPTYTRRGTRGDHWRSSPKCYRRLAGGLPHQGHRWGEGPVGQGIPPAAEFDDRGESVPPERMVHPRCGSKQRHRKQQAAQQFGERHRTALPGESNDGAVHLLPLQVRSQEELGRALQNKTRLYSCDRWAPRWTLERRQWNAGNNFKELFNYLKLICSF